MTNACVVYFLQLSNGEVQVHFTDGSELGIQAHPMLVKYTDAQGTFSRWETTSLPLYTLRLYEYCAQNHLDIGFFIYLLYFVS